MVALQRLRQEVAEAWPRPSQQPQGEQQGAGQGMPTMSTATSASLAGVAAAAAGAVFLTDAIPQAAASLLAHGSAGGWQTEEDVLVRADAMAAALSLLRFILLREAAQPLGLMPPAAISRLLEHDLLPLQACVRQLLALHAAAGLGISSGVGAASSAIEREELEGFLGVQRLEEALEAVIALARQRQQA